MSLSRKNVDLEVTIEGLKVEPANQEGLNTVYEELEFKSWLNKRESKPAIIKEEVNVNYELLIDEKDLNKWSKKKPEKAETVALRYRNNWTGLYGRRFSGGIFINKTWRSSLHTFWPSKRGKHRTTL